MPENDNAAAALAEQQAAADAAAATAAADAAAQAAAEQARIAAPQLPEKYTLTLPEGSYLSPAALERAEAQARALKLPDDATAQGLVGLLDGEAKELVTTYEAARKPGGAIYDEMAKRFEAEAVAHPALGNGDAQRLAQIDQKAALVLARYGPELGALLKEQDPASAAKVEFRLMLSRISEAIGEKALAMPTKDAPPAPDKPLDVRFEERYKQPAGAK